MNITLSQEDIEAALHTYIKQMGINTEIQSINFTTARKGGFSIEADVEVAPLQIQTTNLPSTSKVATPSQGNITVRRNVDPVVVEEKTAEPVKAVESKPVTKSDKPEAELVEEKSETENALPRNLFAQ